MQHDAWFFVGIFAFIFIVWVAVGGPTHSISFAGPTLALPGALGGGSYLSLPTANLGLGSGNIQLASPDSGSSYAVGSQAAVPPSSQLSGVSFGTPSTYRGIVWLSHSVSGAGASTPNNEYVRLTVSQSAGTPVDLSGWTIESEATGKAAVIPQGTETPTSGIVNAVQDIVLQPGESAMIESGYSPIGASFKENKCIGYFSQFQSFSPTLPQTCPYADDELAAHYDLYIRDGACLDYTKKVARCAAVLSPPVNLSGSCQTFLVKYLNYNGCVDAHKSDADFNGSTWRIYLGRTAPLFRASNEVVKLVDKDGKTVDAFSY